MSTKACSTAKEQPAPTTPPVEPSTLLEALSCGVDRWERVNDQVKAGILLKVALNHDIVNLAVAVQRSMISPRHLIRVELFEKRTDYAAACMAWHREDVTMLWLNGFATLDQLAEEIDDVLPKWWSNETVLPSPSPCEPWCTAADNIRRDPDHLCQTKVHISDEIHVEMCRARDELGEFMGGPEFRIFNSRLDGEFTVGEARQLGNVLQSVTAATGTQLAAAQAA